MHGVWQCAVVETNQKRRAGKILEQFAQGASIGYGSVFCTGQDVPPGLHPQGREVLRVGAVSVALHGDFKSRMATAIFSPCHNDSLVRQKTDASTIYDARLFRLG